jgi:probable HAF family extracellular repeat protein
VGTLPGYPISELLAINDHGEAVGDVATTSDAHAAVWTRSTGLMDLNTMIAPSTFELARATAVSSNGYIVGYGWLPNGDQRGFLLSPTLPQ